MSEQAKFGKNSISDEQIRQALGAEARSTGGAIRTAQGRYLAGKSLAQGQTVFDVSSMKAKVVLQEVFGLERRMYFLDQLCTPRPMNQLTQVFYVASQGSAHRKLAKGQEADINMQQYLKVTMDLWLNAGHVVMFDEDQLPSDIPVYGISQTDAAGSLAYAKNQDIADEIVTASTVGGHNWGTMTTPPNSDNDPLKDIADAINALTAGGTDNANVRANPSILAMHPTVWKNFITNSYISRYVLAQQIRVPGPGAPTGSLSLPMFPNLSILVDGSLVATTMSVVDPRYFILGTGPQMAVGYRNDLKRLDGHVIYEYLQPKLVTDQGGTISIGVRTATGVS